MVVGAGRVETMGAGAVEAGVDEEAGMDEEAGVDEDAAVDAAADAGCDCGGKGAAAGEPASAGVPSAEGCWAAALSDASSAAVNIHFHVRMAFSPELIPLKTVLLNWF